MGDVPRFVDLYAEEGGGQIKVEYIDPAKTPGILSELDPDGGLDLQSVATGSYLVSDTTTGKRKIVGLTEIYSLSADSSSYSYVNNGLSAEQAFSGAIQYVASKDTSVVYFVSGHSEADYATSYKTFVKILAYNNFETQSLDIRTTSAIPGDAAMLAFLDPQFDISLAEKDLLTDYVKSGGRLLVICGYNPVSFPNLNSLLVLFNIEVTADHVREGDASLRYGGDPYTFIATAPTSAVSAQSFQLVLGAVRRLQALNGTAQPITSESVLTTSASGISEPDGDAEKPSVEGTQVIGMASENKGWKINDVKSAKVVVLGSGALISEAALTQLGDLSQYNQMFVYYAMEWLIDVSKNSLYIPAKKYIDYQRPLPAVILLNIAKILVAYLVPVVLVVLAILVLVLRKRRRSLGAGMARPA